MKKAPEWIAEEIEETRGCPNELCLDARRGLAPPRALVDEVTKQLRLEFAKHTLEVALPGAELARRSARAKCAPTLAPSARSLATAHVPRPLTLARHSPAPTRACALLSLSAARRADAACRRVAALQVGGSCALAVCGLSTLVCVFTLYHSLGYHRLVSHEQ